MAIISNFELLLKPIAPPAGPAAEVARVAIQGYFLEISNLENRDITLIFRTRTSVKQPADSVNTELISGNHDVVYDITQDNVFQTTMTLDQELIPGKQYGHYVSCIQLPAGQTGSLAILPRVQSLLPAPADLAIRGYTELVLSTDFIFGPQNNIIFQPTQSANILVSPEHRGTFIDPEFNPGDPAIQTDLDFDQSAYSLPIANGMARQNINTHANFNNPFQDFVASGFALPIGGSGTSAFQLSQLGRTLSKNTNTRKRTTAFKIGSVPVRIEYAIQKGKYVVEEESIATAIKLLTRRKRLSPRSLPSTKVLVKTINDALGGSKAADAKMKRIFKKLMA